jgi:purine-binding chemotaxis protein CheW
VKDNYIVFSVADTAYALASQQVAHVEMVEHITPVPNAPAVIDGVVFSRGEIVPALNLRARFGFPRIASDLRTRLLVVRHDGRTAGLLVDAAREFMAISAAAIHPPNEGLRGMSGRYLSGIATIDDRMVLILDLAEVLNLGEALPAGDGEPAAGSPNRSMSWQGGTEQ